MSAPKTHQLNFRVSAETMERLQELKKLFRQDFGPTTHAREAMLLGLEMIEKDPTALLLVEPPKRGGARKGAGRKAKK